MTARQSRILELTDLRDRLNGEYRDLPDRHPQRGVLNRRIQAAGAELRRLGRRGALA